ncbi:UNVERIFIED_CONTAM: hypothetical protein Sradi_2998700 [Sesamum radiatum]|uniref:Reverse transcriptase zinc-binding domain-containing protein n=1 Tax=Sesamum radiatum TaxID=300843 RepID=A0AAW2S1S8_SESRA
MRNSIILMPSVFCRLFPELQIWHFGTKGKFSISSAYGVFQNSVCGASSSTKRTNAGGKGHWHFICGAKVPPKVRLFAWRSCKNALPTQSNLAARRIHLENVCLCCDQEEDGLAHILRRCSFASWSGHFQIFPR